MAKTPQKPPLSLVGGQISGEIETFSTPLRPLGSHGQRLWSLVQGEYGISDAGGKALLTEICLMTDRAEELRASIARDGAGIYTKTGPRLHPACHEETALRVAIGKMIERLGLNLEPIRSQGGQPRVIGWTGER
jgi:hypothetical protein